jgi:LDH2 family malate/lactate/ureidoglycolate dehydrogenase
VFATDLSIQLARRPGAGVVAVHRSSHYGAAGYSRDPRRRGGHDRRLDHELRAVRVPYGGVDHALGTNPIAIAAPTPDGIWDTDMATSQVAVNKIFNARDEGRTIPRAGASTRGPHHHRPARSYAAVPLGGYKGYALAQLVEVLFRRAVGLGRRARHRPHLRGRGPRTSGTSTSRIDVERLAGREHAAQLLARLLGDLKAIPPRPGFDEVLVPGEPDASAGRAVARARRHPTAAPTHVGHAHRAQQKSTASAVP